MTTQQRIIRNKVALLRIAGEFGNVSRACKVMGFSRDGFYRYKKLYDTGGEKEINRRKPILKNRISPEAEEAAVQTPFDEPAYGQQSGLNGLRKKGFFVSRGPQHLA